MARLWPTGYSNIPEILFSFRKCICVLRNRHVRYQISSFYRHFHSRFRFTYCLFFNFHEGVLCVNSCQCSIINVYFSIFLFQLCVMVKFQDSLRYLNNNIRASFERDMKNPELHTHALRHFSVFYNFCRFYTVFIGSTIILMIATPLYFAFKKGKYIRMYPQYLPFVIKPGLLNQ